MIRCFLGALYVFSCPFLIIFSSIYQALNFIFFLGISFPMWLCWWKGIFGASGVPLDERSSQVLILTRLHYLPLRKLAQTNNRGAHLHDLKSIVLSLPLTSIRNVVFVHEKLWYLRWFWVNEIPVPVCKLHLLVLCVKLNGDCLIAMARLMSFNAPIWGEHLID